VKSRVIFGVTLAMQINFQHIAPNPLLKGYVEKLWVFESEGKAFSDDIKLIVPNDRMKLAIPFRNGILAAVEGKSHLTKEHTLTLTGMMDMPLNMDIETNENSGTLCAEFSPRGAYYFFKLNFNEIKNKVLSLSDILGSVAKRWEERIANAELIDDKVSLFQQFLLSQFLQHKEDRIFEFCVGKIKSSEGKITVKELEKQTGYSSRWLNMKFVEKLGVSPKNLASIIRFKNYYEALCNGSHENLIHNNSYYHYYYDQSHFIKDFKRFTGLTPTHLSKKINDWGRIFYNV